MQNLLGQIHRARPVSFLFRYSGQRFEHAQILLAIIRALLIDPVFIAALHEFAAIKRDRLFVTSNAAVKVALAPRGLAVGDQPIEFLRLDAVRKFRIKLVIAVAIDEKVLLERLIAVERLANVRHRGVKILFHGF